MDLSQLTDYLTPQSLAPVAALAGLYGTYKVGSWGVRRAIAGIRLLARPAVMAGALMVGGGALAGYGCDGRMQGPSDPLPPTPALSLRVDHGVGMAGVMACLVGAAVGFVRIAKSFG